jgi:hypothetical protein
MLSVPRGRREGCGDRRLAQVMPGLR